MKTVLNNRTEEMVKAFAINESNLYYNNGLYKSGYKFMEEFNLSNAQYKKIVKIYNEELNSLIENTPLTIYGFYSIISGKKTAEEVFMENNDYKSINIFNNSIFANKSELTMEEKDIKNLFQETLVSSLKDIRSDVYKDIARLYYYSTLDDFTYIKDGDAISTIDEQYISEYINSSYMIDMASAYKYIEDFNWEFEKLVRVIVSFNLDDITDWEFESELYQLIAGDKSIKEVEEFFNEEYEMDKELNNAFNHIIDAYKNSVFYINNIGLSSI